MGEVISDTKIKREKDFLYYVSTNKETGNLTICKAKLHRGGTRKKKGDKTKNECK